LTDFLGSLIVLKSESERGVIDLAVFWGFVSSFIIGGVVGVFTTALCVAAKSEQEEEDNEITR